MADNGLRLRFRQFLMVTWRAAELPLDHFDSAVDDLWAHYTEPHRRYHGPGHIVEGFELLHHSPLSSMLPEGGHLAVVGLAWAYHDVICDPSAPKGVNEDKSGALAQLHQR